MVHDRAAAQTVLVSAVRGTSTCAMAAAAAMQRGPIGLSDGVRPTHVHECMHTHTHTHYATLPREPRASAATTGCLPWTLCSTRWNARRLRPRRTLLHVGRRRCARSLPHDSLYEVTHAEVIRPSAAPEHGRPHVRLHNAPLLARALRAPAPISGGGRWLRELCGERCAMHVAWNGTGAARSCRARRAGRCSRGSLAPPS